MKTRKLNIGTLTLLFFCFTLVTTGCHDSIVSSNEDAAADATNRQDGSGTTNGNDSNTPGDDDGTSDQGSGDNGDDNSGDDSNTPGDDDGTDDQGSGDNGDGNSNSGSDGSDDDEARMEAGLAAEAVNALASGKAKYEVDGSRQKFSTEVEDVSVDGNGQVIVYRGAELIFEGAIRIQNGIGDLNRDTENGNTIPAIQAGDRVEVSNSDGVLILTGRF